jgi:hypothetical protein
MISVRAGDARDAWYQCQAGLRPRNPELWTWAILPPLSAISGAPTGLDRHVRRLVEGRHRVEVIEAVIILNAHHTLTKPRVRHHLHAIHR